MTAQTPVTPEISLVEAVWRYRLMSLIIVLASVLASVAATQILFSGATATARFAVTDPTNNNNALRMGVVSGQGYAAYTAQRAAFAGSTPVMARAAEIVKSKHGPNLTGEQLRGRVKTSSKPDGGVVVVTANGSTMPEAAVIANAVLQAYQDVTVSTNNSNLDEQIKGLKEQETKITEQMQSTQAGTRPYKVLQSQLAKMQSDESGLLSARSKNNDGVQFTDTADPTAPTPSKLPQNGAIGFAIGAILACIVSFLRASSRPRGQAQAAPAPAMGGMPGGAPAGALGGPGTPMPELPAGRSYQGRRSIGDGRDDAYRSEAYRSEGYTEEPPPPAPERGRGRRSRRSAPPAEPAGGRGWAPEEGRGGAVAPSASATQAVPASPPPLPPERGRSSRVNGAGSGSASRSSSGPRGTRVAGGANGGASTGNGASGLPKTPPASGKPPRKAAPKGRSDKPAEGDKRPASDIAADLWPDGGDPTRTAEDPLYLLGGKTPGADKPPADKPAADKPVSDKGRGGKPEPGSGSGKGKGDSSLMHYDLDR
jgi:capsular polysaccharide biosynthesis protein